MFFTALLPASTPTWLQTVLEVLALLVAARVLLGLMRKVNVGVLTLAAAAWVGFFYPPGHAWMLTEALRMEAWAKGVLAGAASRAGQAAGVALHSAVTGATSGPASALSKSAAGAGG